MTATSLPGAPPTAEWDTLPALQQPDWRHHPAYDRVREKLADAPPLVLPEELRELRAGLAAVARGEARLLQVGDCAESFYESTAEHTARRIAALDTLADRLADRVGQDVIRVGRLGGQYAKPRTNPTEVVDGITLPSFRGHLVNSEVASVQARWHNPRRLLWGYQFSGEVQRALRARRLESVSGPWSSHDALVIDYDGALVRTDPTTGARYLGSTHFPWVGLRTGDPAGAHVALLAAVVNPVAAKLGPATTPADALALCAALDPDREPGRLTLIARVGADAVAAALPPLVRAVRDAGHPVVWLSDPMHGNTLRTETGRKTRHLDTIVAEAATFLAVLAACGVPAGGLHLETSPDPVTECVGGAIRSDRSEQELATRYTSLCDPRLNTDQAAELVDRVFVTSKE
ncbi:phospho-2-dehydro-3-deoxyheptonate aldolase [Actinophytocola xinjiangensis]|uniref:Phospho-2-dehydro-3-deoxyheptonate aldolase n=1 Tax=Actinophytocola xinjiangensis TaxID=485602 RepID=A0A7Z0WTC5_9PSEU|nr:3-deoxy-7-phosphoheptulonate synthase [Actinophytocola xinjiangensis]OLF14447.1 phospho-2-dehydro-3-deoxyheptonate aldolase [Actinophytocola xinjiangensis]